MNEFSKSLNYNYIHYPAYYRRSRTAGFAS